MVPQQFRHLDPNIQSLKSLSLYCFISDFRFCPLTDGKRQAGVCIISSLNYSWARAETTFDSQCGSPAAIVYYTINCLHSSLLLQVLNLLRLPVWGQGCQLADREVLVLQLVEVINSPNCQKVTAGRKFLPWGHSWIPASCSLIYQ